MLQVPALHVAEPPHRRAHRPQCAASLRRSVSQEPSADSSQLPNPSGQVLPPLLLAPLEPPSPLEPPPLLLLATSPLELLASTPGCTELTSSPTHALTTMQVQTKGSETVRYMAQV